MMKNWPDVILGGILSSLCYFKARDLCEIRKPIRCLSVIDADTTSRRELALGSLGNICIIDKYLLLN